MSLLYPDIEFKVESEFDDSDELFAAVAKNGVVKEVEVSQEFYENHNYEEENK